MQANSDLLSALLCLLFAAVLYFSRISSVLSAFSDLSLSLLTSDLFNFPARRDKDMSEYAAADT